MPSLIHKRLTQCRIPMQVVLEAVADAVSQLILFSVEAEENKSVLPNVTKGASGVAKAVQILINIGEGNSNTSPPHKFFFS